MKKLKQISFLLLPTINVCLIYLNMFLDLIIPSIGALPEDSIYDYIKDGTHIVLLLLLLSWSYTIPIIVSRNNGLSNRKMLLSISSLVLANIAFIIPNIIEIFIYGYDAIDTWQPNVFFAIISMAPVIVISVVKYRKFNRDKTRV